MENFYNFNEEKQFFNIRSTAKKLAHTIGFDSNSSVDISTIFSELTRNFSAIGKNLDITMEVIQLGKNVGIEFSITAFTNNTIRTKFSVNGHLGSGLENIKRRVDNFCISSSGGEIKVITQKWIPAA